MRGRAARAGSDDGDYMAVIDRTLARLSVRNPTRRMARQLLPVAQQLSKSQP